MKLKIVSKEKNPLMKRTEVTFSIDHDQTGGTPSRAQVRIQLAGLLKTRVELVYIRQFETKRGTMVAVGEANVYNSVEQAKLVEPKHIFARNVVPEKPEEPQAPKESKESAVEEKEES